MSKELSDQTLIFIGSATLSDKTKGHLWLPEAEAARLEDCDALREAASPFKAGRAAPPIVGGRYSVQAIVEDGQVQRMRGKPFFLGRMDHDGLDAMEAMERQKDRLAKAMKAEARARKQGARSEEIEVLARIAAKAPYMEIGSVASGFAAAIRDRAMEIKRGAK